MLNPSKIRKRTHWFQITSCFLASAMFWNVARAREWISLREWSGGTAQLHIFEGTISISIWILAVFTHFYVSFASLENSIICHQKTTAQETTATVFEKNKSPNLTVKLEINFSINLVLYHWYHFCFYLAPKISQKKKTALNVMFEIFNIFWKARSK